jgi:hypothetical protein
MIAVRIGPSRLSRIVVVVNATGVRISGSVVSTFFVGVELRELTGAIDNGWSHSKSYESCDDDSGVDQSTFHIGLPTG